jgi:MEMO1 family protein
MAGDRLIHAAPDLTLAVLDMVISRRPGKVRTGSQSTRRPAVAGSFYPGEPDELRRQVGKLLADADGARKIIPKALIAPHAGYIYSGRTAAAAFATLGGTVQTHMRVVLIGPAHYVPIRGIAVPISDAFATPLGRVTVDREALNKIADLPFVAPNDAAHAPEHALEVELPFLQIVLPSFSLVPLVVGDATAYEVAQVLARLWGGPETLLVISSDLSHYHGYEIAQRLDAATAAAIEKGEWRDLGPSQACGCLPIAGLLLEANRRKLKARRLSLCNSGDTAGPRDRVVGYGAWVFG